MAGKKDERNLESSDRPTRRSLLKIGAVAAPAVATLSPNMAFATYRNASILACAVDMPDYVDRQGRVLDLQPMQVEWDANGQEGWTKGRRRRRVFRAPTEYTGEELREAGVRLNPGRFSDRPYYKTVSNEQFRAHVRYLSDVKQKGGIGASCLLSIHNHWTSKNV